MNKIVSVLLIFVVLALVIGIAGCTTTPDGSPGTTTTSQAGTTATTVPTTFSGEYDSWGMMGGAGGQWADYRITETGEDTMTMKYEVISTSPQVIIEITMSIEGDPDSGLPEQDLVIQMVFTDQDTFDMYMKIDFGPGLGESVIKFMSSEDIDPESPGEGMDESNPFGYDTPDYVGMETVSACGSQYQYAQHFHSAGEDIWVKTDGSIPVTGMIKQTSDGSTVELCDHGFSGAQEDITAQERADAVTWEELLQNMYPD